MGGGHCSGHSLSTVTHSYHHLCTKLSSITFAFRVLVDKEVILQIYCMSTAMLYGKYMVYPIHRLELHERAPITLLCGSIMLFLSVKIEKVCTFKNLFIALLIEKCLYTSNVVLNRIHSLTSVRLSNMC